MRKIAHRIFLVNALIITTHPMLSASSRWLPAVRRAFSRSRQTLNYAKPRGIAGNLSTPAYHRYTSWPQGQPLTTTWWYRFRDNYFPSELQRAIKGNNAALEQLKKEYPSQETLLHIAISKNDINSIILLLGNNKNLLEIKNKFGQTPLHHAVEKSNGTIVDLLLAAGANPNTTDTRGQGIFQSALYAGNVGIIQKLVNHNASITLADNSGMSALDIVNTAEKFIIIGAPFDSINQEKSRTIRTIIRTKDIENAVIGMYQTAIQSIIQNHKTDIINILLSNNKPLEQRKTVLKNLLREISYLLNPDIPIISSQQFEDFITDHGNTITTILHRQSKLTNLHTALATPKYIDKLWNTIPGTQLLIMPQLHNYLFNVLKTYTQQKLFVQKYQDTIRRKLQAKPKP